MADIREKLYVPDGSIHALLNVFAPRNADEFARVVAPTSRLICVLPVERHLQELRQYVPLLTIEAHKRERILAQFAQCFTLIESTTIEYQLALSRADVVDLIMMTPNHWHVHDPVERTARLHEPVVATVGFNLLVFQRRRDGVHVLGG